MIDSLSFCLSGNILISLWFWRIVSPDIEFFDVFFSSPFGTLVYHPTAFWLPWSAEKSVANITGRYPCTWWVDSIFVVCLRQFDNASWYRTPWSSLKFLGNRFMSFHHIWGYFCPISWNLCSLLTLIYVSWHAWTKTVSRPAGWPDVYFGFYISETEFRLPRDFHEGLAWFKRKQGQFFYSSLSILGKF